MTLGIPWKRSPLKGEKEKMKFTLLMRARHSHLILIKIMFYTIYTKSTDPFTQAWAKRQWGWMTFKQVLQIVAAMEKRINHPPHAIKVTSGKTGDKLVLEWSRIEERSAQAGHWHGKPIADKIEQLQNEVYELQVLWKTTIEKFIFVFCVWYFLLLLYLQRGFILSISHGQPQQVISMELFPLFIVMVCMFGACIGMDW